MSFAIIHGLTPHSTGRLAAPVNSIVITLEKHTVLVWNETDVLSCLEVEPEIEPDAISYKYTVKKDGLRFELLIYQCDGDVYFDLYRDGVERPVFFMKLLECPGIRYMKEESSEYLEFAHAKCFGSRYDGESVIPFGVRLWVNPSIRVELF